MDPILPVCCLSNIIASLIIFLSAILHTWLSRYHIINLSRPDIVELGFLRQQFTSWMHRIYFMSCHLCLALHHRQITNGKINPPANTHTNGMCIIGQDVNVVAQVLIFSFTSCLHVLWLLQVNNDPTSSKTETKMSSKESPRPRNKSHICFPSSAATSFSTSFLNCSS